MSGAVYNGEMGFEDYAMKYESCGGHEHACVEGSRTCLACGKHVCFFESANDNVFRSLE